MACGVFHITKSLAGPARDLHSGAFGGTVHEPMTDLITLLGTLVNSQGDIIIKGIDDMVPPPADEEEYAVPFFVLKPYID